MASEFPCPKAVLADGRCSLEKGQCQPRINKTLPDCCGVSPQCDNLRSFGYEKWFLQLDSPIVCLSGFDVGICRCSLFLSGPIECIERAFVHASEFVYPIFWVVSQFQIWCRMLGSNFCSSPVGWFKGYFYSYSFTMFYHVLPCFIWYWNLGHIASYNHDIWDLIIKLSAAWPLDPRPRCQDQRSHPLLLLWRVPRFDHRSVRISQSKMGNLNVFNTSIAIFFGLSLLHVSYCT